MYNSRILKKIISIVAMILISLSVVGCAANKEALPLHEVVQSILYENGIYKSKVIRVCDRSNQIAALYDYQPVEITDDELQKYVDELLVLHEKMIEITDRDTVRKGDVIVASYVVYYNSEIVSNAEHEPLIVGTGKYFEDFENAVIGAVVGEPFTCEISAPIDTEKYKKGDILKYNITVESINYFKSYISSDQYILDYYGVKTEEEFFAKCKLRLEQIKNHNNSVLSCDKFLDEVAEECEFYIDKKEAAAYSKKIVNEHKDLAYISGLELNEYIDQKLCMTEDEFYDYCYDEGVKEIKQYLLVGASRDISFSDNENFRKFCSMTGYDSTQSNNTKAKYDFLKITKSNYLCQRTVPSVLIVPDFNVEKAHSVVIYESSNVFTMDFSTNKNYNLTREKQDDIISLAKNLKFGKTAYSSANNLYDTVLVFKFDGEKDVVWLIDNTNGYIKWQLDGDVVCCKLSSSFSELVEQAK